MHRTVRGVPFFCIEKGKQDRLPVIFLHGFPFSHSMWSSQIDAVGNLYRAIAYDLRGHGKSYVGDGQYMIDGHVDDLIALMDHLNLERAVVVGLSMGGYIALRALELHREKFAGVVLCDTRSESDTNEAKQKRYAGSNLVKGEGSAVFAENFVGGLFAPDSHRTRKQEIEMIRETIRRTSPLSIAGTLIALAARTDSTGSLAKIAVPALIMVGEFDALTPPAASEAMHERIAGSDFFVIPQAGHLSNLENPEFFNEKLMLFLKRIAG